MASIIMREKKITQFEMYDYCNNVINVNVKKSKVDAFLTMFDRIQCKKIHSLTSWLWTAQQGGSSCEGLKCLKTLFFFFSFNFIVLFQKGQKQLRNWSIGDSRTSQCWICTWCCLYLVTVASNRYLLLLVVFFKSNWTKFSQTKRHFHANLDFVFVSLIKNFLF